MRRLGLIDLLGVILLVAAVCKTPSLAGDPGVGWHLRSGEWMAEELRIPRHDPFLLTSGEKVWVHNQWLSDLVLWKLYEWGGWPLLHLVTIGIVILLLIGVLPRALRRVRLVPLAIFGAVCCGLPLVAVQWFIRPVIFSFLLFGILYATLLRLSARRQSRRTVKRAFLLVPILFALWANIHPGFVVGLILIGVAGAAELLRGDIDISKRFGRALLIGALGLASTLATLVNPYGIQLHRGIAALVGDRFFMNLNQEWLSTDFHIALFTPTAFVLLLVYGLLLCRVSRPRIFHLLAVGVFTALALQYRRYLPFLGIVSVGLLADLFTPLLAERVFGRGILGSAVERIDAKDRRATQGRITSLAWVVCAFLTLYSGALPGRSPESSSIDEHFPREAVNRLAPLLRESARVFHSPDWGGFLIYHLWPRVKPFIDDRNELNGRELYEEFFSLYNLAPGWRELLERYEFEYCLLDPRAPLAYVLRDVSNWQVIYEDRKSVLLRLRGTP